MYSKKLFEIDGEVTNLDMNHIQEQYEEAVADLERHENKKTNIHGIPNGFYIVKTKNLNQQLDFSELTGVPDFATSADILEAVGKISAESLGVYTVQQVDNLLAEITLQGLGGVSMEQVQVEIKKVTPASIGTYTGQQIDEKIRSITLSGLGGVNQNQVNSTVQAEIDKITPASIGAVDTQSYSELVQAHNQLSTKVSGIDDRVAELEKGGGGTPTGGAVVLRVNPSDPQENEIFILTV